MLVRQHRGWRRGNFICSAKDVPRLAALHMPTGASGLVLLVEGAELMGLNYSGDAKQLQFQDHPLKAVSYSLP